jgi:hypothetical protein
MKSAVVTVVTWTVAIGRVAWAELHDRSAKGDRDRHIAECRDREDSELDGFGRLVRLAMRDEIDGDIALLGEMFAQLDEIEALQVFCLSEWVA